MVIQEKAAAALSAGEGAQHSPQSQGLLVSPVVFTRSLLSPGLFFPSLAPFGLPRSSVTPALGLPPHSYQIFVTPLPSQSAFPAGEHKKKLLETSFTRAAINPTQISYMMLTHL